MQLTIAILVNLAAASSCHSESRFTDLVILSNSYTSDITSKPASVAASPRRLSAQTKGRYFGRPLHHTSAAASWNASNARRPNVAGIDSALASKSSSGRICIAFARKFSQCLRASDSLRRASRPFNRANALRTSTDVPHQTAGFGKLRNVLRAAALNSLTQQRGTIALVSQKARSVLISFLPDDP